MPARPAVLVIAATDSTGGAGLTRDAETLAYFGVDGLYVVTAVTAQSSTKVAAVHHVPPETVRRQIAAALETRKVGAIKIGMLGTRATVEAVAGSLLARDTVPIVLDPVLAASSGGVLLDAEGASAMRELLIPRVTLLTPNIPEAAALLSESPARQETELMMHARRLRALGPQAVLLKGGHGTSDEAVDLLVTGEAEPVRLSSPRLNARRRGTGCALASAIAAGLASSLPLADACQRGKQYVLDLLRQTAVAAKIAGSADLAQQSSQHFGEHLRDE